MCDSRKCTKKLFAYGSKKPLVVERRDVNKKAYGIIWKIKVILRNNNS